MTEIEKKIIAIFSKAFPAMTEREKERLLDFGDGMAFMAWERTLAAVQQPKVQAGA